MFNASCSAATNSGKCPICQFTSGGGTDTISVTGLNTNANTTVYYIVILNLTNPMAGIPLTNPICTSFQSSTTVDTATAVTGLQFTPLTSTASVSLSSTPPTNSAFAAFTAQIITS